MSTDPVRPPSVDALARELATSFTLPHIVLVDCARRAIQSEPSNAIRLAHQFAHDFSQALQVDVVNAT